MGHKILVIDDDVTALDIVDFLFEDSGFEVTRRTDGASALEFLASEKVDVVIVDLMMPKMTGQECIRKIRAQGLSIPIVAFTALDDPAAHREATTAGANKVLTKPCRPATLVKEIGSLIAT